MKHLLPIIIVLTAFATAGVAQNVPANVPINGLIGYWGFSGNANDESGNNNNGTNNGATLTTDRFGKADSAYLFDGTSSYISIPSSVSLESPARGLTMSAWVNINGVSLVGQSFGPIITKTNSSSNGFMYRMDIDMNATGFYAGVNDWSTNEGVAYNFNLNEWYLVTAAMDTFTTYLYLNDTLVATIPYTTTIANNTLPLEFGRDEPGYMEIFNGKIDDIGIWNRPLTQQEISTMYNGVNTAVKEPVVESEIELYPNPAARQIHVRVDVGHVGAAYVVTDPLGKTVQSGKLNARNTTIAVGNLPPGVYVLSTGENGLRKVFNVMRD